MNNINNINNINYDNLLNKIENIKYSHPKLYLIWYKYLIHKKKELEKLDLQINNILNKINTNYDINNSEIFLYLFIQSLNTT